MRTVSSTWAKTIDTSHQIRTRVEVWLAGAKVAEIPISSGTVTMDMDAESYGAVTLSIADPSLVAKTTAGAVLPYGQRLRIAYAISNPGGWEEVMLDCDFLITVAPTYAGVLTGTDVTASTTIELVKDARFLTPYQPTGGASVQGTLTGLLTQAVPNIAGVTYTIPDETLSAYPAVYERERWEAVQDLVGRMDAWLQPTLTGFRVSKIPTVTGAPVWSLKHGKHLLSGTLPVIARDDRYNAVVAYNADDPTVWAAAYVTDPTNPARWDGPYGRRPYFFASPLLAATSSAQAAANTRLANLSGRARIIEIETTPNAAIEPGDILEVQWPTGDLELVLVRKIELPLVPGAMKMTVQGAPA